MENEAGIKGKTTPLEELEWLFDNRRFWIEQKEKLIDEINCRFHDEPENYDENGNHQLTVEDQTLLDTVIKPIDDEIEEYEKIINCFSATTTID